MYFTYVYVYNIIDVATEKPTNESLHQSKPIVSVTSLTADFTHLLIRVCHILSDSPDNLRMCIEWCCSVKIHARSAVLLHNEEKIAKIQKCKNFKQLFEIISHHMSWDDHSILTEIVNICECREGLQEVEKFQRKLALFQALQIMSITTKQKLSEDFVRFCGIVDKPYRSITFREYEEIKAYVFSNLDVSEYTTIGFLKMLHN